MLLFGLHCHQPVDNFGWVVDKAIDDCYYPLLKTLYNHSDFKFSIHFSGWLLEYLKNHSSDIFSMLQTMSKRGQVEFFSGGFYEPILEAIPKEDRANQIKRMNNYIKRHFSQIPKGLWLTERVYGGDIVEDIVKSGIKYMVVDDIFTDTFSYVQTGDYILKLLPINKTLRYSIPFKEADSVEILLKSSDVNIIFDDCEKFGVWPGTNEWVYKKKWLEKFLSKDFQTVLPRDFVKLHKPVKVAMPNHSYQEMEQWSLDNNDYFKYKDMESKLKGENDRDIFKFLRGGVWKNFLNKYFEANWIQKRVWYLSKNKINKKNYIDSLYKAQCNDVLWHGIFGGLYLPNLRDNAYKHIIECENMLNKKFMEKSDIDGDLADEFIFRTKKYIAVFNNFGEMIEFDDKENLFNFQNTLRRYKEHYHFEQKEKKNFDTIHNMSFDFNKYPLTFDDYFKFSFITDKEQFRVSHKANRLDFLSERVQKTYRFYEDRIDFSFKGSNSVEMNLHFANEYSYNIENSRLVIEDEYTKRTITMEFSDSFEIDIEDIVTYSLRENGVDSIKQGVSLRFEFKNSDIKGCLCLR